MAINKKAIKISKKHLLGIQDLSISDINLILDEAKSFITLNKSKNKKIDILRGKTQINLFFEPSTRTQSSFELAGKRLGADVMSMNIVNSAIKKGETLIDTAMTLNAMHPDIIVIRHQDSGACNLLSQKVNCAVLNAGDGRREHPTQALLDALTIIDRKKKISGLKIVICGDILHSRVARSNLWALSAFGADVILCGPETLISDEFNNFLTTPAPNQLEDPVKKRGSITICRSLEESIKIADAVIVLRIQKERMMENLLSSIDSYSLDYGLTPEKLSLNNKEIPILHPGPINRDIEISSKVVDRYPNCLINNQVANGIPIRMALLYLLQKNNK